MLTSRHLVLSSLLVLNACSSGTGGTDAGGTGGGGGGANTAPVAAFTSSALTVVAGEALSFDATSSTDPDGDALRFDWSFSDSTRGAASKLAHVFSTVGSSVVTLTVDDGRGGRHTATKTVTVTAGPVASQMAMATVRVFGSGRTALAGAKVQVIGGASATTDASGVATVSVGAGVKQVLRVEKAGYTRQTRVTTLSSTATTAVLEVSLRALPPAVMLADAAAGGSVAGVSGAKVTLPPNALRTAAGASVTGAVEVQIAPVNVVADALAFPGRWSGIAADGTRGSLVSFGTVDFVFTQGGARLDLAPGARATIELPVFPKRNVDGTALAAGATLPLWALDENSGEWIREGQGTLVASASSPTGLAQRAEVGHFSWWNCDDFTDVHKLKLKCCVDADGDGTCMGGDVVCWVGGRTCNNASCDDDSNPYPQYGADETIANDGGTELLMPDDLTIVLDAYGPDGLTKGRYVSAAGTTTDVSATIVLAPYLPGPMDQVITLPFDLTTTAADAGTATKYLVDADAGQNLWIAVERGNMSQLTGTLRVKDASGTQVRSLSFDAVTASYVQPVTAAGRYTIEVASAPPKPIGSYRLRVRSVANEMYVVSQTPAVDSTVVAPANITVTFGRPVNAATVNVNTFKVFGPLGEVARASTNGIVVNNETVTFTPLNPLGAGIRYRVQLTTGIRDATNAPLIDAYQGAFSTLDVPGSFTYVFPGQTPQLAIAPDGTALLVGRSGNFMSYVFYTPGSGWTPPELIPAPVGTGFHVTFAVAVSPAGGPFLVAYTIGAPNSSNPPFTIYSTTFTPTAGWTAPIEVPIDPTVRVNNTGLRLQMDAAGRGVLVWEGNVLPYTYWFNRYLPATGWGTPAQVSTVAGSDARFALNADGKGALAWRALTAMRYARYDPVANTFATAVDLGNNQGDRQVEVDAVGNVVVMRGSGNTDTFLTYDPADGGTMQTRLVPGSTNSSNCRPSMAMTPGGTVAVAFCKVGPTPFVDRWPAGVDFTIGWDPSFQLGVAGLTNTRMTSSGEDLYVIYGQNNVPVLPSWRRYVGGMWDATATPIGAPLFGNSDEVVSGPTRIFYVYQQGAVGRIK